MRKVIWLLLLTSCNIDRTVHPASQEEIQLLATFQDLPAKNQVQIAEEGEPGERLLICLTIVRKEDQTVVANQNMHFYHTSVTGEYQPSDPNDESTARLNGSAVTDSNGRILVETILPGDYGSSSDNRHIHTTISSARPTGYDIHFKQYTNFMGKQSISDSDQHFLADLKKLPGGTLVTFIKIEAKRIQL